ncbi:DUF3140 domain-containing protein, partial [Roseomonas sp. TAS13]
MSDHASDHAQDADDIRREFGDLVNMTAEEMRRWLDTPESWEVGWHDEGEAESVGHHSGRWILEMLERGGGAAPDEDELAQMRRVVGYVRRHLAQGPAEDIEHSRWRFSLMNWGHDPVKTGRGSGEPGVAPSEAEPEAASPEEDSPEAVPESPAEARGEGGEAERLEKPRPRRRAARKPAPEPAPEDGSEDDPAAPRPEAPAA